MTRREGKTRGRKSDPLYWSDISGNALQYLRVNTMGCSALVFAQAMGWGKDADIVFRYERGARLPRHIADQIADVPAVWRKVGRLLIRQKRQEIAELRVQYGLKLSTRSRL